MKKYFKLFLAGSLILAAPLLALDCPPDSAFHIDNRQSLPDGSPNPNYGQLIATGLCACVDFNPMLEISDSTVTLTVIMVDNEPVRGFQMDIYNSNPELLSYELSNPLVKGEKILNVTDSDGNPRTMVLMANQIEEFVRVMAYSTSQARTAGDSTAGTLFQITFSITSGNGAADLPDSIAFGLGELLLPNSSASPPMDVACGYPDTLNMVPFPSTLGIAATDQQLPTEFSLAQNYPNPFNPSTRIAFAVAQTGQVQVIVYNLLGQTITTLVNSVLNPGRYAVVWNGRDWKNQPVASGIYFYELRAGDFSAHRKMLYLR